MAPTQPLTVTLEAQQWEMVLRLLHKVEAPMVVTRPLADEISRQCMQPQPTLGPLTAELHQLHPFEEGAS